MFIDEIRIRNFRSIIDRRVKMGDLTIFVGNNDVGKSNVLKALNLFFNGHTDHNMLFNFEKDHCFWAKQRKRKAEEIIIEIDFVVPSNFKDAARKVRWKKVWRKFGEEKDLSSIRWVKGGELGKVKVKSWLRKIDFRYVPAIKSDAYFSDLLGQMYKVFSNTIGRDVKSASGTFVNEIRKHTSTLSDEIKDALDLVSKLQLPEDLSDLFSDLDFETEIGKKSLSLKRRGDGIKVRHVPVVLKFLADKERIHHIKGDVRQDTIWGYEEPENNIEYSAAFKLADMLQRYNKDIQILMTTHSPVFYAMATNEGSVEKYSTQKLSEGNNPETVFHRISEQSISEIDESMGFLPLVAPRVNEVRQQLEILREVNAQLEREIDRDQTCPIIFVEGISDKKILDAAWKRLYKNQTPPFILKDLFDCHQIKNILFRGDVFANYPTRKFVGLLDFDAAFEFWEDAEKKKKWERVSGSEAEGMCLKHPNSLGWLLLLPVPEVRRSYAKEVFGKKSSLSIELLFEDDIVRKHCDDVEQPGDVNLLKFRDEKKTSFAQSISKLKVRDFRNFRPLFKRLIDILKDEADTK